VAGYEATFKDFAARTGIDVQYEGSKDFETLITVRAEGGNAPDIAGFPQPGLMASLAQDGKILDISSFMPMDELKKSYIQSWLDLGTIDGKLSGVFYRASVKSLVWYPVKPFKEAGYEIPTTWKELETLQDKMVADGNTPWCIGLEHAGATGWVATDWLEEIVLRTAGPDTYNQWIKHEIPFNDPAIKSALDTMGTIWLSDKYVYGGPTGVLSTNVGDSPTGMFDNPPSCFLHRQAGWISSFFPEGTKVGEEADFFYFPPIDEAQGKPVLGGGDVFSMMNDRPEVRAVMQYLTTPDAAKGWIKNGGFISPLKTVPLDWYTNPVERKQAEIMQQATVFGFDASDLMPASVGTGTFWKGMVDYVGGTDPDTVLQTIEDSWPKK
jgi:alpha-glucoside transport system substrate-binding protein